MIFLIFNPFSARRFRWWWWRGRGGRRVRRGRLFFTIELQTFTGPRQVCKSWPHAQFWTEHIAKVRPTFPTFFFHCPLIEIYLCVLVKELVLTLYGVSESGGVGEFFTDQGPDRYRSCLKVPTPPKVDMVMGLNQSIKSTIQSCSPRRGKDPYLKQMISSGFEPKTT